MDGVFHDTAAAALFSAAKMNKVSLFASPRMFCDIYCLEPGQEQRPHRHAGNDKIYYALTGTCRVTVGAKTQPLRPGGHRARGVRTRRPQRFRSAGDASGRHGPPSRLQGLTAV